MDTVERIELRLTPQEAAALLAACGMAGYAFVFGDRPDLADPHYAAMVKVQRALKDYANEKGRTET